MSFFGTAILCMLVDPLVSRHNSKEPSRALWEFRANFPTNRSEPQASRLWDSMVLS